VPLELNKVQEAERLAEFVSRLQYSFVGEIGPPVFAALPRDDICPVSLVYLFDTGDGKRVRESWLFKDPTPIKQNLDQVKQLDLLPSQMYLAFL